MSLTPADLARLAALAALEVPEAELPGLAAQVDRIVAYVGQLATLADTGPEIGAPPETGGTFRPDQVRSTPMTGSPADFAPQFVDGFFVVPR